MFFRLKPFRTQENNRRYIHDIAKCIFLMENDCVDYTSTVCCSLKYNSQ